MAHSVTRAEAVLPAFHRLVVDLNDVQDRDRQVWSAFCNLARGMSAERVALLDPDVIKLTIAAEKLHTKASANPAIESKAKKAERDAELARRTVARRILRDKNVALGRILKGVRHLLPPAETIRAAA